MEHKLINYCCVDGEIYIISNKIPFFMEVKDDYCGHKNPPLVPVLCQMNPTGILTPYFFNAYFNITLLLTIRHLEWFLLFMFSDQNRVCISYLSSAFFMPRGSQSPRFDHIIIFVEEYKL
jgi:hypothetical protein